MSHKGQLSQRTLNPINSASLNASYGCSIIGDEDKAIHRAAMNNEVAEPNDFASLYHRAFEQFGPSALWSSRPVPNPTPADALAITHSLRVEGNLQARKLAEQIEKACRATLKNSD